MPYPPFSRGECKEHTEWDTYTSELSSKLESVEHTSKYKHFWQETFAYGFHWLNGFKYNDENTVLEACYVLIEGYNGVCTAKTNAHFKKINSPLYDIQQILCTMPSMQQQKKQKFSPLRI
jgi:hypothetical protein